MSLPVTCFFLRDFQGGDESVWVCCVLGGGWLSNLRSEFNLHSHPLGAVPHLLQEAWALSGFGCGFFWALPGPTGGFLSLHCKDAYRSDFIYLFIYLFIKINFFLERGDGREREKYQCVVASCVPPTGDLACNPGMCPDWELNWLPFASVWCSIHCTTLARARSDF